jgi:hypothetical protein
MTSWVDVAGWTLLHFVWQGSVIALLAALALRLLRSSRPQIRYVVACGALGVMLAAPAATVFALTSARRVPIGESAAWGPAPAGFPLRLLRSSRGSVLGVPLPSSGTRVEPARRSPGEGGPAPVNTDTLFSALVTLWMAGVAVLLVRLTAGCWRIRQLHAIARLEQPSHWHE